MGLVTEGSGTHAGTRTANCDQSTVRSTSAPVGRERGLGCSSVADKREGVARGWMREKRERGAGGILEPGRGSEHPEGRTLRVKSYPRRCVAVKRTGLRNRSRAAREMTAGRPTTTGVLIPLPVGTLSVSTAAPGIVSGCVMALRICQHSSPGKAVRRVEHLRGLLWIPK